jgi:hypothetical protein
MDASEYRLYRRSAGFFLRRSDELSSVGMTAAGVMYVGAPLLFWFKRTDCPITRFGGSLGGGPSDSGTVPACWTIEIGKQTLHDKNSDIYIDTRLTG